MSEKKLQTFDVKVMSFSELRDHPNNPRKISENALKGLLASIEHLGLIEPIIWNKRSGFIVGGHQRVKALKAAGYTEAQVLIVDYDSDTEMVANAALNNTFIQGDFTEEIIENIRRLQVVDPALTEKLMLNDLAKSGLGKMDEKPEIQFSQELGESNNYVVLVFKNDTDFLQAQTLFGLETVYSQRRNGQPWAAGIGRVLSGPEAIKKIQDSVVT
jgi:hypothetical protein